MIWPVENQPVIIRCKINIGHSWSASVDDILHNVNTKIKPSMHKLHDNFVWVKLWILQFCKYMQMGIYLSKSVQQIPKQSTE